MNWWAFISGGIKTLLSMVRKHTTILSILSPFLAPILALWGLYELLEPKLTQLTYSLSNAVALVNTSGVSLFTAKVNRIWPFSEMFMFVSALLGIKITAALIRMIKSVIPTIS